MAQMRDDILDRQAEKRTSGSSGWESLLVVVD
jgi:hypothetical protein